MRVVIACPGPSLGRLDALPSCDASIAINRAALRFPATWWACCDYPMFKWNVGQILGTPNLFTRRATAEQVRGRLARFPSVALVEDIRPAPDVPRWDLKTLTCAMAFAASLGATAVDVWGASWEGTADYDGKEAGEDRSPERWAQERRDFEALAAWMNGRGCEVTRCGDVT